MSFYVQAEAQVSVRDLVCEFAQEPQMLCEVLQGLSVKRDRNGKLLPLAPQYAAAYHLLDQATVDNAGPMAGIAAWAEAFRSFDCIDRERALRELARVGGFKVLA
jgi:hypothetical protein